MVVASRFSRVASVFASVIHSTYSLLQLGGKASNVADAFLFRARASIRISGTTTSFFPFETGLLDFDAFVVEPDGLFDELFHRRVARQIF